MRGCPPAWSRRTEQRVTRSRSMASIFNGQTFPTGVRVDASMALPFWRGARRARLHPTGSSWGDTLFRAGSGAAGVAVLALLGLIAIVLTVNAAPSLRTFGLGFLVSGEWNPVTDQFGALPFIYGTLLTSALALLLGVPVSLGIAIFVSELAPPSIRVPLTYVVELLAAVPSV